MILTTDRERRRQLRFVARGERVLARAGTASLLIAASAGAVPAQELQRDVHVELLTGSAWSLPLPITVRAAGRRTQFTARYSTQPFADAPYYSYRFGVTNGSHAVEVEMLHHKLYLENPQPPLDRFEVTHGFNQPMVNVAFPATAWQWRAGIGMVVAHAQGRIAGGAVEPLRTFLGGGYQIAGVSAQAAFGRRYALGGGKVVMTAVPEAKVTAGIARVRFDGGSVLVRNVALHTLAGFGVRQRR